MYNGATETIQNFTPPMLTISSDRSLGERWSCRFARVSLVRPIARDIGNPRMKMPRAQTAARRGGACVAHHPRDLPGARNLAYRGMEPIRLRSFTRTKLGPRTAGEGYAFGLGRLASSRGPRGTVSEGTNVPRGRSPLHPSAGLPRSVPSLPDRGDPRHDRRLRGPRERSSVSGSDRS